MTADPNGESRVKLPKPWAELKDILVTAEIVGRTARVPDYHAETPHVTRRKWPA